MMVGSLKGTRDGDLYHIYANMLEVALEIVINELKEAVDWNHGLGHVGTKSL
jgi:hypothetical protein